MVKFRRGSRFFGLLAVVGGCILALAGCATTETKTADDAPSYPVKSVADASASFDAFDRKRAIHAYHRQSAHMLFELAINRNGDVVRLKVVRSNLDDYETAALKTHVRAMKFTPAPDSDPLPYRILFYPLGLRTELTIDGETR